MFCKAQEFGKLVNNNYPKLVFDKEASGMSLLDIFIGSDEFMQKIKVGLVLKETTSL